MTFAEQLILLTLSPKTGEFHALPRHSLPLGLAGAFLLEMAFRGVIDTDDEALVVLREQLPGRPLLETALQVVRGNNEREISLRRALGRLGLQGDRLLEQTLRRLVERGTLERRDKGLLFRLKRPRFPHADDAQAYQDIVERIRALVLDPEGIPSPEEAALLGLARACRLQRTLFSEEERARCETRFRQLAEMDLVGRAIIETVRAARDKELLELASE